MPAVGHEQAEAPAETRRMAPEVGFGRLSLYDLNESGTLSLGNQAYPLPHCHYSTLLAY